MARKAEEGLQYFPLNSDIVNHRKIKLIISQFGMKAWGVIIPLFCKIYREKGYYLDWYDEDQKLLFAQDECKSDLSFVSDVVTRCVKRGVFDETIFDVYGILTSDRVQENFLEAKRRQQRVEMIDDFVLISADVNKLFENVNIIPLNVNIISKKVDRNAQNKIKQKKNRIEENNTPAEPPLSPPEESEKFKNFKDWINQNAPAVAKMKEPFTEKQFEQIKEKFPVKNIQSLLLQMHNWQPLLKKNQSAYLTFINWSTRENNGNSNSKKGTSDRKMECLEEFIGNTPQG